MTHACSRLLLLALTAMLLAAAPAAAQQCNAPPGTAAVDQYCENAPSASGNGGGSGGSGGSSGASAPRSTVRALDRSGATGKELNRYLGEDVASARGGTGTTKGSKNSSDRKSSSTRAPAGTAPTQPSSNPLGAVQSAVNSGTTVGGGFIWALVLLTLLIAGVAWTRYRRRSSSE
jgi:hypothetical protein